MTEETLLTIYARAWNGHDARTCADCFAAGARREYRVVRPCSPSTEGLRVVRGTEAIAADIGMVMHAVPDLSIEVVSAAYASDRRVWTEWRLRGTHTEDWDRWRADGRRIEVLGVSVFRIANEGFLEERLYWDSAFARGRRDGLPGLRPEGSVGAPG
ncbi:MAG: nuclear transport factor 2 family protein [Thermoleophilia bacterium]